MYGWTGNILRVNLTNGEITKESLNLEMARKFIGGRGLNLKYLYDEVKPGIDPLGPDNKLIFGAGPACGTLVPSSQRWNVTAKSPMTGFIGDAGCGGSFGIGLKYAGYDMVIIEGKSEKPLYLWIDDDDVQLRDASFLFGKKTTETVRAIKRDVGDPDAHIACIGTAGDNVVRFANIMSDNRTAGKTGMGAVMGSKKLKAIAARGTRGVRVADIEKVEKVSKLVQEAWRNDVSGLKAHREVGSGVEGSIHYQTHGILPTRNYREGVFEGYSAIHGHKIAEYWLRPKACFSCPVACSHMYIVNEGPYAGTFGEALYGSGYWYGGRWGNSDLGLIFKLSALSDQYGVDEAEVSSVIGWLMECYELGIITAEDLGGIKMEWGNVEAIKQIFEMIVHRRGIGDLLAEGPRRASEVIGKGSGEYVMDVKGLAIDSRDPRGSKGWALGYAVSSRGAEHCRTFVPDWKGPRYSVPAWLQEEVKGFKGLDRLADEGKGAFVKFYEDMRAFQHSLQVCIFAFKTGNTPWTQSLAEAYSGITGHDISGRDVMTIGERIINLERAYNIREGLTRKDDSLPKRFLKEPLTEGETKGVVVNLGLMLDEYYKALGWDNETGFPTRQKLEQLGLQEVADELSSMGKTYP